MVYWRKSRQEASGACRSLRRRAEGLADGLATVNGRAASAARNTPVSATAPRVRVSVLGAFAVRAGVDALDIPPSAQRVLALLAIHDRPLQRMYVASTLWLDSSEEHANACLRTALWRLRGPHAPLVRAGAGVLTLDPSVSVDLWEQTKRARAALNAPELPSPPEIEALSTTSDVLPDWYDDWVVIAREQFRQKRLHALERLCERLAAEGRFAEASEAGLAAVAADPLRESAHRTVIRAHMSEGNANEALRQYAFYRGLLLRELDLEPTPAIERLLPRCAHRDVDVM